MSDALIRTKHDLDMVELEQLCNTFHAKFKDRRRNCDDGGMAVLEDLNRGGSLSSRTAKRLFHWCHTDLSYKAGVELARRICTQIYGRVPTREELEAADLF